jgi:hypothetical protein
VHLPRTSPLTYCPGNDPPGRRPGAAPVRLATRLRGSVVGHGNLWPMSEVRDPSLLVVQVQSEQQHGDGHPDRQRCSVTQVTEPANQQGQAGATQDAVDGSDHAGPGEQRLRWRRP